MNEATERSDGLTGSVASRPQLRFTQIQCVPVPNTSQTQCNVYMFGLTESGEVWFKRDVDAKWMPESMAFG